MPINIKFKDQWGVQHDDAVGVVEKFEINFDGNNCIAKVNVFGNKSEYLDPDITSRSEESVVIQQVKISTNLQALFRECQVEIEKIIAAEANPRNTVLTAVEDLRGEVVVDERPRPFEVEKVITITEKVAEIEEVTEITEKE